MSDLVANPEDRFSCVMALYDTYLCHVVSLIKALKVPVLVKSQECVASKIIFPITEKNNVHLLNNKSISI